VEIGLEGGSIVRGRFLLSERDPVKTEGGVEHRTKVVCREGADVRCLNVE
jgi:hypothetical protein